MSPALAGRFLTTAPPGKPWPLFSIHICIKKIMSIARIPCRLPSFLWRRIAQSSQRIVFLKCPLQSCFAGKRERKTELGHKESSPAPFGVVVGPPHYGARSPSHPCLEILVGIVSPDAVPGLFSPLPCSIPHHPHPCSPALPLPGVKWGKFQSGVNVYCLLETLKNKNSS